MSGTLVTASELARRREMRSPETQNAQWQPSPVAVIGHQRERASRRQVAEQHARDELVIQDVGLTWPPRQDVLDALRRMINAGPGGWPHAAGERLKRLVYHMIDDESWVVEPEIERALHAVDANFEALPGKSRRGVQQEVAALIVMGHLDVGDLRRTVHKLLVQEGQDHVARQVRKLARHLPLQRRLTPAETRLVATQVWDDPFVSRADVETYASNLAMQLKLKI